MFKNLRKKTVIAATLLLGLIGSTTYAYGNNLLLDWSFRAPALNDKDAIDPVTPGDIVFETGSDKFFGWNGSGWLDFSSSNATLAVSSKTSNYTLTGSDDMILANANSAGFTLSLPAVASYTGKVFYLKKTDSTFNVVTIDPNSSEQIDGASTTTLNTKNEMLSIVSDGTTWHIIERKTPSEFTSFSMSVTGTGSNPTEGSGFTRSAQWRRVGDSIEIIYNYSHTNAGSAGTGTYLFPIPSGLSIDTSKVAVSTTANGAGANVLGNGMVSDTTSGASVSATLTAVLAYDSTNLAMTDLVAANQRILISATEYGYGNTSIYHSFRATIPISGWNP